MADGTDQDNAARTGELFISRAGDDKELAILIAHILRDAGYTTFLQDENFGHASFMARMREGFAKVDDGGRVVALLSNAYMRSEYCMAEADYPLTGDPSNKKQRLIVFRIEDCAPSGFLKSIPWAYDLTKVLHDATALAHAVRGAIDPKAPEANYAAGLKYAPTQILHPEIRAVPGFAGRADLLESLDRALWQHGGTAALTDTAARSAAVHGLGGVGKSVLAQEYGWLNRTRYRGVWWLRAETEQTLTDDLIALGSRLVPGLEEIPERDRAVHRALDAIEQSGADKPWLLIYDNAEKPAAIEKLTPRTGAHLLITSRCPDWHDHGAQELPVDVFPPPVAADYLLARARHPQREPAERLAEALGFLPLALSHARATCWRMNWGFDKYRESLSERIKKAPPNAAYPASVFATLSLAIEKAEAECSHVGFILGISAFLAPERIPLDIFTPDTTVPLRGWRRAVGLVARLFHTERRRDKAMEALAEVSLITFETLDDGSPGIEVHRLVQKVMRGRVWKPFTNYCVHMLNNALAANDPCDPADWPRLQRLAPHVASVLDHIPDSHRAATAIAALCNGLANYLYSRAEFASAEPLYKRALTIAEKVLGPEHPETGKYLNNLAGLYRAQGCYEAAEPLYIRAVAIVEKTLGSEHPETGIRLSNLAGLYENRGKYEAALPLYLRALGIGEKALGVDHPDVGTRLNNLAGLYKTQGRYEAAEPLYLRALGILGPEHPNISKGLNNLAVLYHAQGRYEAAESLYLRALAIDEITIGPEHPDVGTHLNNLAGLYKTQGKYEAAEPLCIRALTIVEKALGPKHPETGICLNNLAGIYRAQAKYEAAEPLCIRAVEIFEKGLGPDHPNTKTVRKNYEIFKAERPQ